MCAKTDASKRKTARRPGKKVLDEKGEPVRVPGNVEARESDRLVCRGIRNRAGFDEPDEY